MSQQGRLSAIEQWLQREEEELLYTPDCGDRNTSQGARYAVDEILTRISLSYLNTAASSRAFGVAEEVRDDGTVVVRVGFHESRTA